MQSLKVYREMILVCMHLRQSRKDPQRGSRVTTASDALQSRVHLVVNTRGAPGSCQALMLRCTLKSTVKSATFYSLTLGRETGYFQGFLMGRLEDQSPVLVGFYSTKVSMYNFETQVHTFEGIWWLLHTLPDVCLFFPLWVRTGNHTGFLVCNSQLV